VLPACRRHLQVQAAVPQQHPVSQHPLAQPQLVSFMVPPCGAVTPPSQGTAPVHSMLAVAGPLHSSPRLEAAGPAGGVGARARPRVREGAFRLLLVGPAGEGEACSRARARVRCPTAQETWASHRLLVGIRGPCTPWHPALSTACEPSTKAHPVKAGAAKPRVLASSEGAALGRHRGAHDGRAT
jgi:hypothetical protein